MVHTQLRSTCCRRQHAHRDRQPAHPPGPDDPLGGRETKTLAKARYRSLQGAGATACFRARPTDSLRVIPATDFVSIGRGFMGIEEHAAVRCPCCDATGVDTRHARICPRAGAQVNQPQPLLPCDLLHSQPAWGTPSSRERGTFTADKHVRVDNVVRRGTPQTRNTGTNPFYSGCDPCRPASTGTLAGKQR